jgi:hypothetical protein
VKRSGRDEPLWIAIHKYMEATLGISQTSKNTLPFLLSLNVFSSTKSENKRAEHCGGPWGGTEGGPNDVYIYD